MSGRFIGTVAAVVLVGSMATAQTPGSSQGGDIMPALLQEVRGLRAAIEQMTASASRVQLALGRLQLQEQRLNAANGRLAETRNSLAGVQRRVAEHQEQVSELEGMLSGQQEMPGPPGGKMTADEWRREITGQLHGAQRELTMANAELQRLTSQESALANDVSAEQARWSDLNQRLEDLERSLRPVK